MSIGPPPTGLPDNKTTKDSLGKWQSSELAPYWLSAIIESADDAIVSKTLDGIITSWNKGAERIFGYTADEAVGQSVTMLIPEDHSDEEPGIIARIKAGERVEHYETIRVRKDGSLVDISLTVSPIIDADGKIIGASKIARDISDRKRAEEALRSREEELTDFIENSAVGLHWVGPDGLILWANKAELELLGYTREEYIGHHIAEFHADSEVIEDILGRLSRDETLHSYEARLRCKDGSLRHVLISSNVRRQSGEFVHTRCFTRDITERKQAEREIEELLQREREARRQAEEASNLKDEFLATVSHELRTPLTAILGWAHLLRAGQLDEKGATRALETVERNARAQSQLIDDLLDVSRIITGKLRLDVRQVDPGSFIEAAIEAVRPAAEAKNVRVQKVMDTGVVSIAGDPARLQQVVWNLLSNAIKFTPKGGRVQVRLERVNSHIEIAVSDTGVGIKPEFLPYVFDRFRQADMGTTRQHGGLGLGLAIVRHLVELHGGMVQAESPGEGQGATFVVKLPVPVYQKNDLAKRVHPAARETLPSYDCPERLDGLKVLVVDDEADTRELLRIGIGQCGAQVRLAASAQEALEAIENEMPDLLISDIGMPGEDGYELIRRVRALPAKSGGRIPAIALTAYARTEDRMQALRAGYQMHVPKPVEMAELMTVAASLVHRGN
jgi:PAS domain S-box-containing protein